MVPGGPVLCGIIVYDHTAWLDEQSPIIRIIYNAAAGFFFYTPSFSGLSYERQLAFLEELHSAFRIEFYEAAG